MPGTDGIRVGVYPGSFNPFTIGHLEVAEAALEQRNLDRIHLAVSRTPLAKAQTEVPSFTHRIESLCHVVDHHDWLDLVVTDDRLLVDIAAGYDLLIMGADKWEQIHDVVFYDDSPEQRDAAIAALPEVAVAPRPPHDVPPELALDVPEHIEDVSSSGVRGGADHWMHPAVADFDGRTGAWSAPHLYRRRFIDPATA